MTTFKVNTKSDLIVPDYKRKLPPHLEMRKVMMSFSVSQYLPLSQLMKNTNFDMDVSDTYSHVTYGLRIS